MRTMNEMIKNAMKDLEDMEEAHRKAMLDITAYPKNKVRVRDPTFVFMRSTIAA
jgi:hypothetical protein